MPDLSSLYSEASLAAHDVDAVFVFITIICAFFFVLTQGLLIYFALKYRRRKGVVEETPYISGHTILEIIWVIVPSLLLVAIFAYGFIVFVKMRTPIPGATEIQLSASQFSWNFKYPNGHTSLNELRLPVGKPVKLVMTSTDVLHGMFIPAYRQKQDVLPGRYTYLWILPKQTGKFDIYCSQYCGSGHSLMRGTLIIMSDQEYAQWQAHEAQEAAAQATQPPEKKGEEAVEHAGCLGCHSIDGMAKVGPTLKGVFGRKVELADGKTVTADEEYLRESLVDPNAKVVKGFQPIMPSFKATLKPDDISAVIAYLKTLK
ncbi:cytochrome c oxidase subunit II [Geomonas sp. RF6]|uniref:cytochrome c oxidase subunit II n=1 Tax=Geomonas sp. RF6 TaxID=2897342 RepID=UPI001E5E9AA3|nr:cytochrome c oxidase subunit II [Geomonas sp. RF6]UFS69533.1 cytochrome c oxidase subunit II [Geomonas sp. RF6]